MTAVFFDPQDYLERDPATAKGKVEAERLLRETRQQAKLCEALTQLAAEQGFNAVTTQEVFTRADLGAETEAGEAGPATGRAEAGLEALVGALAERPSVACLVAVEIRVPARRARSATTRRWHGLRS